MSEAGKYLFRADNVWLRCVQYFVIASSGFIPREIDVCVWCMFVV